MGILFFLKRIGFFFLDNWRFCLVIAGIFALIFGTALLWKRCNPPPKLDEKDIRKAEKAIAQDDREEMIKVLAESDAKEDAIDSNIKAIENKREEAKQNYTGKSNDELAAELERRMQESK